MSTTPRPQPAPCTLYLAVQKCRIRSCRFSSSSSPALSLSAFSNRILILAGSGASVNLLEAGSRPASRSFLSLVCFASFQEPKDELDPVFLCDRNREFDPTRTRPPRAAGGVVARRLRRLQGYGSAGALRRLGRNGDTELRSALGMKCILFSYLELEQLDIP